MTGWETIVQAAHSAACIQLVATPKWPGIANAYAHLAASYRLMDKSPRDLAEIERIESQAIHELQRSGLIVGQIQVWDHA